MAGTVVEAAYATLVVSTTSATPASAARYLVGIVNLSGTAQTSITYTVTDNNANAVATVIAPGASQVITYPPPGLPCNGITITASGGTPVAPGVAFLYRTNIG